MIKIAFSACNIVRYYNFLNVNAQLFRGYDSEAFPLPIAQHGILAVVILPHSQVSAATNVLFSGGLARSFQGVSLDRDRAASESSLVFVEPFLPTSTPKKLDLNKV